MLRVIRAREVVIRQKDLVRIGLMTERSLEGHDPCGRIILKAKFCLELLRLRGLDQLKLILACLTPLRGKKSW
jgi:hypothetical protein